MLTKKQIEKLNKIHTILCGINEEMWCLTDFLMPDLTANQLAECDEVLSAMADDFHYNKPNYTGDATMYAVNSIWTAVDSIEAATDYYYKNNQDCAMRNIKRAAYYTKQARDYFHMVWR